ncbi:MAG: hypothetical protein QM723_29205 [Myxococcaceae bacterium]
MRPGNHHRWAASALVALFVLGQGALFVHQLLVPHQECAEHGGELIHVSSAGAARVFDAAAWLAAPAPAALHGHDHCLAFTSRRHDAGPALEPSNVELRVEHAAVTVPETRVAVTNRDTLLRLAPKSSPPV